MKKGSQNAISRGHGTQQVLKKRKSKSNLSRARTASGSEKGKSKSNLSRAQTASGSETKTIKNQFLDGTDRVRIADPPPQTGNPNFTKIDPLMIINKKSNVLGRRGGDPRRTPKQKQLQGVKMNSVNFKFSENPCTRITFVQK